jgi:hypothetical protein
MASVMTGSSALRRLHAQRSELLGLVNQTVLHGLQFLECVLVFTSSWVNRMTIAFIPFPSPRFLGLSGDRGSLNPPRVTSWLESYPEGGCETRWSYTIGG